MKCRGERVVEDCWFAGPDGGECEHMPFCRQQHAKEEAVVRAALLEDQRQAEVRNANMRAYLEKFPDRSPIDFMLDSGELSAEQALNALDAVGYGEKQ